MSVPDDLPLSVLEQRLRDAFAAAAEIVAPHSIGDLPRPVDRRGRGASRVLARVRDCRRSGSWDRRSRAWERQSGPPRFYDLALIPLAAAAAVALIATAMTVVVPKAFPFAPGTRHGTGRTQQGYGARHAVPPIRARDLVAGYPGGHLPSSAAPKFFVGVRQLQASRGQVSAQHEPATGLAVYSSVNGRVVANLAQPNPGRNFAAVAALGSDLTFVAAAVPVQPKDGCHTWFYRFSLGPQGRPTGITPLSAVPEVAGEVTYNTSLTANADGSVIAYSALMCSQNFNGQIGVIHLGTGRLRTWSTLWPMVARNLSLTADGALLSIVGNPSNGTRRSTPWKNAAWTLRTDAAAGPVAMRYRRVLHTPGGVQAAEVSPTGAILFALTAGHPGGLPAVNVYDTATGKPVGLEPMVSAGGYLPSLSPDTSDGHVLIYPFNVRSVRELNLLSGQLRTVPVAEAYAPLAAAW